MTIRKTYASTMQSLGERSVRLRCSSESVDLAGEIIVQAGIDLSVYRNNPIVLFDHNSGHPIGTATDVSVNSGSLIADVDFAPKGISQKADEICGLVKNGILKGVSVGVDVVECEPMNPARPRGPQKYLKSTLCEISIVAIPCNTDAAVTAKARDVSGVVGLSKEQRTRRARAAAAVAGPPPPVEAPSPAPILTKAERQARAKSVAATIAAGVAQDATPALNLSITQAVTVQRSAHCGAVMLARYDTPGTTENRRMRARALARGC